MFSALFLAMLIQVEPGSPSGLTGPQLIKRSIKHHDPKGRWERWRGTLILQSESAKGTVSTSEVRLDMRLGRYTRSREIEGRQVLVGVKSDSCFAEGADGAELPAAFIKEHRLGCDRTKMMRNYHTYLYGLPMKLKDPGTRIEDEVREEVLDGQSYLVVRVPYEKDKWDFFIHPETYALEAYRFYVDEEKKRGELIRLSDIETVEGILFPKHRSWTNTHDAKWLGTDTVVAGGPLRRKD